MRKKINLIFLFIMTILLMSCGFKNINLENNKNILIEKINIKGEKKIGNLIKNEVNLVSSSKGKIAINLNINVKKIKKIKDKNSAGKIIKYTVGIQSIIEIIDSNNSVTTSKTFTTNQNYFVAASHAQTRINEKNAIKNLISVNSDAIISFLNFYFKK